MHLQTLSMKWPPFSLSFDVLISDSKPDSVAKWRPHGIFPIPQSAVLTHYRSNSKLVLHVSQHTILQRNTSAIYSEGCHGNYSAHLCVSIEMCCYVHKVGP